MSSVLDFAISGPARCTIEARLCRISALERFARMALHVEGRQFVDKLVEGIEWLAKRARIRSMEELYDRAWLHFQAERREAANVGSPKAPDLAWEAAIYARGVVSETDMLAEAHARLRPGRRDDIPRLMSVALQLYVGTSGPYPQDVAVDALADLLHWCEANGLPMPSET